MKLHSKVNHIERSADFEQSNYTIEATAKAFSILSDQLYSNKVRAVIRELSTNAYDSHVDAGRSATPFEVHLPSSMEPHFSIRDYGTGLGHDDCMHLYTTYFRSNRTDSNDAVGCMGLGSKSPFAYSDSFTVESFFNGEHRTYNAYKNEEDEPVFALLNTQDTSEPNGLKVSFPVTSHTHDNDFDEFIEEAEDLYKFFEVQPKITGQSIEVEPDKYIIEGDGWAVRKRGNYGAYAIMGQVSYPIDVDQFDNNKDRETCSILRTNLNITFDIGELSVTPSRESLSYNKHTIASIIKRCAEIKENAEKVAEEAVSGADTLWDARLSYTSITKSSGLLGGLAGAININEAKWNGTQLFKDADYHNIHIGDIPDLSVVVYYRDGWKKAVQRNDISTLTVDPSVVFFIDDLKRGGISRIRAKVTNETSSGRDAYWNDGGRDGKFKIYRIKGTEEAIGKFRKLLGCNDSHFYKTSDLDSVYRHSSGDVEKRTSIAKWNGKTRGWKKGDNWDDVSRDLNDGGYFVEISRYELEDTCGCYGDLSTLDLIVDCLNNLGYDIDKKQIYGVKTAVRNRAKFQKLERNEGKWINVFDLARKVIEKLLEDGYKELIQEKRSNRDLFCSSNLKCCITDIEKIVEKTTTDNDLKKLLVLHNHLTEVEEEEKLNNVFELARKFNLLPDNKKSKHEPHVKAALAKYPLVKLCSDTRYGEPIEVEETITELARYVDFIERENNA